MTFRNQIANLDALNYLRTLPDNSVNCCVTSPPYWALRDYGVPGQLGLEPTPAEYVANMVAVFAEVYRVLRDDGTLWVNIGDTYSGDKSLVQIPARFSLAMQDFGWILRNDIIWAKPNPMPESVVDRFTKSHEHVYLFTKQPRYWSDLYAVREASSGQNGGGFSKAYANAQPKHGGENLERPIDTGYRNARDVWTLTPEPFPGAHFAVMPGKLVERCLLAGCPETVCAVCGAPWTRVVEREAERENLSEARRQRERNHGVTGGGTRGVTLGVTQFVQLSDHGFQPTCTCGQGTVPGLVLDPFMGSGTVARTGIKLRRDFCGCDLNPAYVHMATESLENLQVRLFT